MKTAVDSSVLILLRRRQPGWETWREVIQRASEEGVLVVCPVTFAEVSMGFERATEVVEDLGHLAISYDPILPEAAFLAGQIHRTYRREGGPREYLVPDFLIAAHARVQADRLAAIDRGYLRRYFPDLTILAPE
jgi:hypothetical protein